MKRIIIIDGSPRRNMNTAGMLRAFLERLAFPWLSYNDYSLTAPKRMPVVLVETMNGTPERGWFNQSENCGDKSHCRSGHQSL